MENFGKNWLCVILAHFQMAQRHEILGQVNGTCYPLAVQISSTCNLFKVRFYTFFTEMCCNLGFWKKTFWILRIMNMEN